LSFFAKVNCKTVPNAVLTELVWRMYNRDPVVATCSSVRLSVCLSTVSIG